MHALLQSPQNFFLHPIHLSIRTSSLKFLKPPFYLHNQISTLTFTLGVQVLPPSKIPDLYFTASDSFPLSEKMVCLPPRGRVLSGKLFSLPPLCSSLDDGHLHLEECSFGLIGNALKSQFLFHGRREARLNGLGLGSMWREYLAIISVRVTTC